MGNELKYDSMDEITTALMEKLRDLFDDEEFIMGVLVYVDNVDDRMKLLEFIDAGDDVSVETVTVRALELNDIRECANKYPG